MAEITAKAVAQLRERTGLGMMECKKALTEADGDMDRAIQIVRERGAKDRGGVAGGSPAPPDGGGRPRPGIHL